MPRDQKCVYCATRNATTRDHVVPRALWGTTPPAGLNLPTVPCCRQCNQSFSKIEPQFMLMASMGRAYEHPVARENWQRVRRTVRNNARRVASQWERRVPALYQMESGLLVPSVGLPFDRASIDPIIEKMMRGFYWLGTDRILPPGHDCHVYVGLPEPLRNLVLQCTGVRLGGGVVSLRWGREEEGERPFALGWFRLYDDADKDFTVTILPPKLAPPIEAITPRRPGRAASPAAEETRTRHRLDVLMQQDVGLAEATRKGATQIARGESKRWADVRRRIDGPHRHHREQGLSSG